MLVKVTKVFKNDTDKNGVKLVSKTYGTPYYKVDMYIEGSDDKYSAFANKMTDPVYQIEAGGTYSIAVTEKPNPNGGVYKNFKLLTDEEKELEELRAFKAAQSAGSSTTTTAPSAPAPEEDIDLDTF